MPQLSSNSSSVELLDVEQIEFVRGPQSALFGRNTLGGIVNVTSRRPGAGKWTGQLSVPFGNFSSWDIRGNASGALIADTLSASAAFSYGEREGYTVNDVTGHDLDSRGAFTGKGQLLWKPARQWEARRHRQRRALARRRLRPQRSRGAARKPFPFLARLRGLHQPRHLRHHHSRRAHRGEHAPVDDDRVREVEDGRLDRSRLLAAAAVTRDNAEEDFQFTQEVRLASTTPTRLSDTAALKWQTGVFLFTQSYQQDAVNRLAPFVPSSSSRCRSTSIRRCPNWTTSASASSARARSRSRTSSMSSPACAWTTRTRTRISRRSSIRRSRRRRSSSPKTASAPSRRSSRSPTGCSPSTTSTRRCRAATRPAASTLRPRLAARPTARKTPGTSRAASSPSWPRAASRSTAPSSSSTGTTCSSTCRI